MCKWKCLTLSPLFQWLWSWCVTKAETFCLQAAIVAAAKATAAVVVVVGGREDGGGVTPKSRLKRVGACIS